VLMDLGTLAMEKGWLLPIEVHICKDCCSLTGVVQYSTVQYSTVQYSTVQYGSSLCRYCCSAARSCSLQKDFLGGIFAAVALFLHLQVERWASKSLEQE
jgi:hypothetical protein